MLTDVSYRINGRNIVHNIDFKVCREQILTIVGPNGAGKSTLLALILGHLKPSGGKIWRNNPLKVSFVPQKFHLPADLPMTVRRFLKDLPGVVKNPWLQQLNIYRHLDSPLQTLSGGETQRLLLARAMLRCPDLIVLDEPAAGIDPAALGDYYHIIRAWQQEHHSAIIMVSHDIHLVMAASDHILCLNQHICCQGRPEVIINQPEFVRLIGTHHPETVGVYTHHHDHNHL